MPNKQVALGGFANLHERAPHTARQPNIVSQISNLVHLRPPSLTTRPGRFSVGTQISASPVLGIHRYVNADGSVNQTLAQAGTQLSRWNGSSWISISNTLPSLEFEAANLNNIAALFYAGQPARKWDGTTLSLLGGSPPQGNLAVEAYQQIFVAGVPGQEGSLYFCDKALPEVWTPAPDNDAGSVRVSQTPIRHLGWDQYQSTVIIWCQDKVYTVQGIQHGYAPALWSYRAVTPYGTPNGRTVLYITGEAKTWIWLTNNTDKRGFAMWAGGATEVVYVPIAETLGTIDWVNIDRACAFRDVEGRYVCSVPAVGGGIIWFMYDHYIREWLTGTGVDVRSYGELLENGEIESLMGDSLGFVWRTGGTTDNGVSIPFSVTIGPTAFGSQFTRTQIIHAIVVATVPVGSTLAAALSTSETGAFGPSVSVSGSGEDVPVRLNVPIVPGSYQTSSVWRLRLSGAGYVTIHDVEFTVRDAGRL